MLHPTFNSNRKTLKKNKEKKSYLKLNIFFAPNLTNVACAKIEAESMVPILDGNSDMGAHVRINFS